MSKTYLRPRLEPTIPNEHVVGEWCRRDPTISEIQLFLQQARKEILALEELKAENSRLRNELKTYQWRNSQLAQQLDREIKLKNEHVAVQRKLDAAMALEPKKRKIEVIQIRKDDVK